MYLISYKGKFIGKSALEAGDPPMCCAEGVFFPSEGFGSFRASVSPEKDNDPEILRWLGLSISISDGTPIECVDVVLFEFDMKEGVELYVDAIGIGYPPYEELFPEHVRLYKSQFD